MLASVDFEVKYVTETELICRGCDNHIEPKDIRYITLITFSESYDYHISCLEQVGNSITLFFLQYRVNSEIDGGMN